MTSEQAQSILDAGRRLVSAGVENGAQEARWVLSQCLLERKGSWDEACRRRFWECIGKREEGEPLQYVLGSVEFFNVMLEVGPGVLIPRPETEQLTERALRLYGGGAILDLCTGSGAIALALAKALGEAEVVGVDLSEEALSYAHRNVARLRLGDRVRFCRGDLYGGVPVGRRFDLIVSNPPYVSEGEYARLEAVVREHEPRLALVAGRDGLDVLRRIAAGARSWLEPGGWLLCEIGDGQGEAVRALFAGAGLERVEVGRDYADQERFAQGRAPLGPN